MNKPVPSNSDDLQDSGVHHIGRAKTWLFRGVGMVLAPCIFLILTELVLRLCGVGYPTAFWIPNADRGDLVTNQKFGWRYFPPRVSRWPSPQAMEAEKQEGTYRVFVLGGSAAYGTPSDLYGFPRMLQVMLEHSYPDAQIEVLNAAVTAVNSHVVRPIALDCAKYGPDAFIMYMGNNEVVGPYGVGSVFGTHMKSIGVIRADIALRSTAVVQGLLQLFDRKGDFFGKAPEWKGMASFTQHVIPPDDPRLDQVVSHYRRNLSDMVKAANHTDALSLVCTVAVNLRDSPPFSSVHRDDLLPGEKERFDDLMAAADDHLIATNWTAAIEAYSGAISIDPKHAEAHFLLARALDGADDQPELALEHYLAARELDGLRFRSDSRLQQAARDVADEFGDRGADLVDLADILQSTATGPAPGREFFYEHVHFSFEGNYHVAKVLFSELEPLLPDFLRENNRGATPPTLEECAYRLGYTHAQAGAKERFMVEAMMGEPPFTQQWQHDRRQAERLEALATRDAATERTTPQAVANSIRLLRKLIEKYPHDVYLRRNLTEQYITYGFSDAAVEQLDTLLEIMPADYLFHTQSAGEHLRQKRYDQAEAGFLAGLEINPYYHVARHNLAVTRQDRTASNPPASPPGSQ